MSDLEIIHNQLKSIRARILDFQKSMGTPWLSQLDAEPEKAPLSTEPPSPGGPEGDTAQIGGYPGYKNNEGKITSPYEGAKTMNEPNKQGHTINSTNAPGIPANDKAVSMDELMSQLDGLRQGSVTMRQALLMRDQEIAGLRRELEPKGFFSTKLGMTTGIIATDSLQFAIKTGIVLSAVMLGTYLIVRMVDGTVTKVELPEGLPLA